MTETLEDFLLPAAAWICDSYALDIRYIARPSENGLAILSASIGLHPLRAQSNISFQIESGGLHAGQIQMFPVERGKLLDILKEAARGTLHIGDKLLSLPGNPPHSHYSESTRDNWFSGLHLQISGGAVTMPTLNQLTALDNELRASTPTFDGLADLTAWLGLDANTLNGRPSAITVRVSPPVDFLLDVSKLRNNLLTIILHAHPSFDITHIGLAIREVPGVGLQARRQIADAIVWSETIEDRHEGVASVQLQNADSTLVMLMVGTATVRRQWFLDPSKARNNRFLAVQHFDSDLRKVRSAVLDSPESRKFEQGVASLFFLLGFSPVVQIETDSPDLIVCTPGGKIVLVECTLRIADIAEKMGKLVDRRRSLEKYLANAGHGSAILAVLICQLPRDQIAAQDEIFHAHRIVLLSNQDLLDALNQVRHPVDPDLFIRTQSSGLLPD